MVEGHWEAVIDRLKAPGLKLQILKEPATIEVESYRFSNVNWPPGPFEGRQMPTFTSESVRQTRTFPAASVLVPMAQQLAKVAINLLEPQAPDSLVASGFFNADFKQKAYGEKYVLE